MKAALYIRVSTDEQATEGYSLSAQRDILENYCIAHDIEIFKIYEDDGYSGRNTNRPAYQRMMAEQDQWDALVILKMDRIHRNSRNFMEMIDNFAKKGKKFISSTESIDTSDAMGRFFMDMMQRIAQLESELTSERTFIGMKEKAESMSNSEKESRTMGFNPPFGYDLDRGIMLSVPEELDVVCEIFNEYLNGATMDSISYMLNQRGQLTKRGNPWNVYNMRTILHNPIYAGYLRWGDVLIKHWCRTAVTIHDFNIVQDMIASRIRDPKKRNPKKIDVDDLE